MDRRLQRLMAYGLQGVEGFYSGFSPAIRKEILTLRSGITCMLRREAIITGRTS